MFLALSCTIPVTFFSNSSSKNPWWGSSQNYLKIVIVLFEVSKAKVKIKQSTSKQIHLTKLWMLSSVDMSCFVCLSEKKSHVLVNLFSRFRVKKRTEIFRNKMHDGDNSPPSSS